MSPIAAHQATGRQRGEGNRPSGNNKSRKVVGTYTWRVHDHEANHAAVSTRLPGVEPPARRYSAYPPVRLLRPTASPMLQKIQPIALRGWREAMMAPTTEKVRTVARVKTALTGSASLSFGSFSTMDIVMRANEIPPTSSATASATSDHANQARAPLLIPPTLSAGVSPWSPLLYTSRETP